MEPVLHPSTLRQRILKLIYPVVSLAGKLVSSEKRSQSNVNNRKPATPVYNLLIQMNDGSEIPLENFKGKKLLVVNTASDCGYTAQYDGLQKLSEAYRDRLTIIGFPSNDFKEQEKGSDESIAQFCRINYGVDFPLAKKSKVTRGEGQNPVFTWLSDPQKNGWCEHQPRWNFSKYLLNEDGTLTHFFDTVVEPLDPMVIKAIES
jgi:glutathione peroxidase